MCINLSIIKCSNEQEIICHAYWKLNEDGRFQYSLSDIRRTLNLTVSNLALYVRKYSDAESETIKCMNCNVPYIYKGRRDYLRHKKIVSWKCWVCNANEEELLMNQMLTTTMAEQKKIDAYNLKKLKIIDKVFLMTVLVGLSNEGFNYTCRADSLDGAALTPDTLLDGTIIKRLLDLGLLKLPDNLKSSSKELVESDGFLFHLRRESLDFSLSPNVLSGFLKEMAVSDIKQQIVEDDGFLMLCREVSLFECISFLLSQLDRHGFPFSPGEKTKVVLLKCLQDYSVGETCVFIWRSVRDSASFYLRENISKIYAANAVIGNIERQYEKTKANDWVVDGFKRNNYLLQSVISRVIFNQILETDDGGFKQKLSDLMPH